MSPEFKDTIRRLRILNEQKDALENIPERIKMLEIEYEGLKATQTDGISVSGGTNHQEEARLSNIIKRMNLERNRKCTEMEVAQMESALDKLSEDDKLILSLFYINRPRDYIDRLCEELHCEVAHVYRKKDSALLELARRLCGQVTL